MVDLQTDDALDAALRAAVRPDVPSPDFAERVLAQVRPAPSRRAWTWYVAVAAAVVVGVWLGWPDARRPVSPVIDPMEAITLPEPAPTSVGTAPVIGPPASVGTAPAAGPVTQGVELEVPLLEPPLAERIQAALDAGRLQDVERLYSAFAAEAPDDAPLHQVVCEHPGVKAQPLLAKTACRNWVIGAKEDTRKSAFDGYAAARLRSLLFDGNGQALTYEQLLTAARKANGKRTVEALIKAAIEKQPETFDAYALGCERSLSRKWCAAAARRAPDRKTRRRMLRSYRPAKKSTSPGSEPSRFETLLSEARMDTVKGNRAAAVRRLNEAVRLRPDDKRPYQYLCGVLPRLGETKTALAACRAWIAKEHNPAFKARAKRQIEQLEALLP